MVLLSTAPRSFLAQAGVRGQTVCVCSSVVLMMPDVQCVGAVEVDDEVLFVVGT